MSSSLLTSESSGPQRVLQRKREDICDFYVLLRLTSESHEEYLDPILNINLVLDTQDFLDLTSWEAKDWRGLQMSSYSYRWSKCWQNEALLYYIPRNEFGNVDVAEEAGGEQNSLGFVFEKLTGYLIWLRILKKT